MKRLQCASCGAPLPKQPAADGRVVCDYCGAEFVADATGRLRVVQVDLSASGRQVGEAVGRAGRWVIGVVAACFAVAMLVTGIVLFVSVKAAKQASTTVLHSVENITRPPLREVWTAATLARLTPDRIDVPLEVSPPPTALARFDPAASLAWALAIAQGWRRDVRLERIDGERLRPDGTVDAAGDPDAEVLYRFWSPGQIEEFHRRADLQKDASVACEFWLTVKAGKITARVLDSRPDDDPLPPLPEIPPLASTFAALSRKPNFPRKPFFDGYLLHLPDEGWVWYLQTLGGQSLDRVRARDGRQWPYTS
jgi:hypothetical protein